MKIIHFSDRNPNKDEVPPNPPNDIFNVPSDGFEEIHYFEHLTL